MCLSGFGLPDVPHAGYPALERSIKPRDPDVLAIQELRAEGGDEAKRAGQLLRELAEATDLVCDLSDGSPAVALGAVGVSRRALAPSNWCVNSLKRPVCAAKCPTAQSQ